jgi:uncharacterized membrane protein YwaF
MSRRLPPLRAYLYVLGTVNVVMAAILLPLALAFTSGVNAFSIGFVALVVNAVCVITVYRRA